MLAVGTKSLSVPMLVKRSICYSDFDARRICAKAMTLPIYESLGSRLPTDLLIRLATPL